jgi:hypothetical protein
MINSRISHLRHALVDPLSKSTPNLHVRYAASRIFHFLGFVHILQARTCCNDPSIRLELAGEIKLVRDFTRESSN